MTVVPNMEGDRRGIANLVFSSLSPILDRVKGLKQTNRGLYLSIKYFVNTALSIVIVSVVSLVAVAIVRGLAWVLWTPA